MCSSTGRTQHPDGAAAHLWQAVVGGRKVDFLHVEGLCGIVAGNGNGLSREHNACGLAKGGEEGRCLLDLRVSGHRAPGSRCTSCKK